MNDEQLEQGRMDRRSIHRVVGAGIVAIGLVAGIGNPNVGQASSGSDGAVAVGRPIWLVQVPYEMPPKPEAAPDTSIPPLNQPLDEEGLKRAEALLPLLEGKQEFWAMGEFVHLGTPATPVLVKGLKMASPRIRYNAIETMSMIKDPSAVPALIETALDAGELSRVREHALRVAVRLQPALVPPAIAGMAKDSNPTVRKSAAFEARYVRAKAVVTPLIELISDPERFVAISAVQSLWLLTRHDGPMHDWEISTPDQRAEWAQEWVEWWESVQETFELPEPRKSGQRR